MNLASASLSNRSMALAQAVSADSTFWEKLFAATSPCSAVSIASDAGLEITAEELRDCLIELADYFFACSEALRELRYFVSTHSFFFTSSIASYREAGFEITAETTKQKIIELSTLADYFFECSDETRTIAWVIDPIRSTTTKPNTDHDTHP